MRTKAAAWLAAATLVAASSGRGAERARFVRVASGRAERTDWVAVGAGMSASGSGRSVYLEDGGDRTARALTPDPGGDVVDAAFVGRRLFLALADGTLRGLHRDLPKAAWSVVPLEPAPRGRLHVAGMDTWLVVAEDGVGLRFLPIRGARACHGATAPETGFLPRSERFVAVAASHRTVYAATAVGGILEIDAEDPTRAVTLRSIPHDGVIRALAASGPRLYVLDQDGLDVLEPAARGVDLHERHPEVTGSSIQLAGRTLRIAGAAAGLLTYQDNAPSAQVFDVSANDDFFSPQDLTVAVGDTVRWTNVTGSDHNVISCTPGENGCHGASAAESFTSGPATGIWSMEHTFIQPGDNPYVCGPHPFFMTGTVTVTGVVGAPPGVPDGSLGAPMRAAKLDPAGSTLSISWDTTTCSGAADHEILYGYAYGLPGTTGGGYELAGARCSIGLGSPFTWTGVPAAFPGPSGFVYWLVVATDAAATEGSWGRDSAGVERQGPAAGGASGECGVAVKSVTNACPP